MTKQITGIDRGLEPEATIRYTAKRTQKNLYEPDSDDSFES